MRRIEKTIVMVFLVGVLSAGAAAAEGIQERSEGTTGAWNAPAQRQAPVQRQVPAQTTAEQAQRWGRTGPGAAPNFSGESLSLEGTVEFRADGAELTTAEGETYELLYPRFLAEGVEINAGDRISVEGFEMPGPRPAAASQDEEDRKYLRITAAEIDGEEYEVAQGYGSYGRGAYGPEAYGQGAYGPGMMGARGHGHKGGYGRGMRGGGYGTQSGYGSQRGYGTQQGFGSGSRW